MTAGKPLNLDAIKARTETATGGPWWAWDRGVGYEIALGTPEDVDQYGRPNQRLPEGDKEGTLRREDAEFIAAAREDVPALVADVERLTKWGRVHVERAELAERERDRLKAEVDRLRQAAERLRADLSDERAKTWNVSTVKCWTNEDGKRFVFVSDLQEALGAPVEQGVQP